MSRSKNSGNKFDKYIYIEKQVEYNMETGHFVGFGLGGISVDTGQPSCMKSESSADAAAATEAAAKTSSSCFCLRLLHWQWPK